MQHHFLLPFVLLHLFFPSSSSIHLGHDSSPDHALLSRVVSARPLHTAQFSTSQRQSPDEPSGGLENPIEIFRGGDRRSQVGHPSDEWFVRDPEFFHDREYHPDSFSREEAYQKPKMNADFNGKDDFKGEHEIEIDGFPEGWFDDPEFFNDPLPLALHAPEEGRKGWDTDSSELWMDDPEFYGDQLLPQEHGSASGEANAGDSYIRRLLRPRKATVEGGVHTGDLREFSLFQWGKGMAAHLNKNSERGSE